MPLLTPADLDPFATIEASTAQAMIDDAVALAVSVAPCLSASSTAILTAEQDAAVKAILRRAVLRWHEVGTGTVTQQTAGAFTQSMDTTRSSPRGLFWPSEITDLQSICKSASGTAVERQVFTVNTGGRVGPRHSIYCDQTFGGASCSCGSYLNNYLGPIPECGELP